MFRSIFVAASIVVLVCGCALNEQFISSVDSFTKVILPEYKIYIRSDSNLDSASKRIRIQTADKFQEVVDSVKKSEGVR